jgi:hypothetical protein
VNDPLGVAAPNGPILPASGDEYDGDDDEDDVWDIDRW